MSERVDKLRVGLAALGRNFHANICAVCKGEGEHEQTYTVGCGMGSYRSMGKCDWCDGKGVVQGSEPASASIINQIENAAKEPQ